MTASADTLPPRPTASELVARPQVLITGHRGDSKIAPENTLPAFASAAAAKADMVELDYVHSSDGVPIVIHDATLDRTTNAKALWGGEKIRVGDKTARELEKLDAGSWFSPQYAGTVLPTLEQAINTIQPNSMTLIERKAGDAATCVNLLKRMNVVQQVVVQAFDWDYLADCHRLAPELVLAALGDKELTPELLDQIKRTGASAVGWSNRHTTPATIAAVHARGWKAWVWTVDEPERVRELVTAGIDCIITNRPAQTRAVVEAMTPSGR